MNFPILGMVFLLISSMGYAQGRKPAVEDFVGIEVEQPAGPGSESLYNLEKDINKIESLESGNPQQLSQKPAIVYETSREPWSLSSLFGISLILGLPLMSWLLIMQHLRKRASVETASNIKVLEEYRKERKKSREDSSEDIRKVS